MLSSHLEERQRNCRQRVLDLGEVGAAGPAENVELYKESPLGRGGDGGGLVGHRARSDIVEPLAQRGDQGGGNPRHDIAGGVRVRVRLGEHARRVDPQYRAVPPEKK